MKLKELLLDTPFCADNPDNGNLEITRVTSSSKDADKNSIFACISGHKTDGHLYLKEAYEKGCRVFLCDKTTTRLDGATFLMTDNVKKTAWELLSKIYHYPQNKMIFIGVTGTKGKTTVVSFVKHLLDGLGIPNATVGTLGITYGDITVPTQNTTPDFFSLFPYLAQWANAGVKVVTLEMSSQSLADERLSYLPIRVGIFTCIGMDHIGRSEHQNFRSYYMAKRKLFSDFPLSFAVVNDDDIYSQTVTDTGVLRYTVSLLHPADYVANILHIGKDSMFFNYEGEVYSIPLPGDYQLYNALVSCAAVSKLFSVPMRNLLPILRDVKIDGRYERYSIDGKDVIIDYAHNATSLFAICSLCKKLYQGNVYAVFGSVGDRGQKRRFDLAKMAEKMCDFCVLTSDNPGFENPYRILSEMYAAFSDKTKAKLIRDRKEAVKYAVSLATTEDVVLLLGKGRESFQLENGELIPYSETEALFSAVLS